VPMQYGLDGTPNWYGPTWLALIDMPLLALGITLLFWLLPRLETRARRVADPARVHHDEGESARSIWARWSTWLVLLLASTHVAVTLHALGIGAELPQRAIFAAVGLLFAAIGNEFGRLKPNRFAGMRMRALREDPHAWQLAHRFAGRLFFAAGALAVIASFALPLVPSGIVVIVLIFGATLVSIAQGMRIASASRAARGQ
jgi:hypothetical protein